MEAKRRLNFNGLQGVISNLASSVGIATGYEMDGRGVESESRIFTVLHIVQTGCGAHLASYPVSTRSNAGKQRS
jgi:hypothetical protein